MPPWAAIECARRGVSWKQKHSTWEPSSAGLAAAAAPPSPDPPTSTVNLRLLLGLPSRRWLRCSSHFAASGPPGALLSSFISAVVTWSSVSSMSSMEPHQAAQHGHGKGDVADSDQPGEGMGEAVAPEGEGGTAPG